MIRINALTNSPKQSLDQTLDNGELFNLSLKFSPNTNNWQYSITYKNFKLYNSRLVLSSNLLRQYRNILPFGIICVADDVGQMAQDPFLINDLQGDNPRVKLFVINKSEILELENALS